jgi:Transglycosylase-like domain/LysM domain
MRSVVLAHGRHAARRAARKRKYLTLASAVAAAPVPLVTFAALPAQAAGPAPPHGAQPLAQLTAVTVPAARFYVVRPGDTLSSIARRAYGSAADWQALWWVNRRKVTNPDLITPGQRLRLSAWHPDAPAWLAAAADKAIAASEMETQSVPVQAAAPGAPAAPVQSAPAQAPSGGGPWPGGAFGNCVVERESGGNPQVMNASGHYGLYQFAESTWIAYGGSAADFGNASVAEQEQVFMTALAEGGEDNWAPYDGC